MRTHALLLALVVLAAGCINPFKGDDVDAASAEEAANQTPTMNTTLPDGRSFEAAKETNRTEEGAGGVDHKHDYWHGKESVVIYDDDVEVSTNPVFERGDNSKALVAFINLEKVPGEEWPALVYEGTGKVTFLVKSGPQWATEYRLTFRTAAQDWTPWAPIAVGKAFEYVPAKIETDMPHSFRSLWNWKLQATGPVPVTGNPLVASDSDPQPLHVTITVEKADNVEDWPPHPAFYDGVPERVVALEKKGVTRVENAADVLVYGVEPDQVVPDRLVSMGTGTLDVFVNITRLDLPPGVPNGGFTLYWRNANTTPDSLGVFSLANETDKAKTAYWHLTITPDMVDSPYQPTSRFGFKVLANAGADEAAGRRFACYRCVPYTIEYTMTIVARPDPQFVPGDMPEM